MSPIETLQQSLQETLCQMVETYGTDYLAESDYYSNEFGIYSSEEEQVLKVFDFFNADGCAYIESLSLTPEKEADDLQYTLILQLYTTLRPNGETSLKYYAHFNPGIEYDAAACDTLHQDASHLGLDELYHIYRAMLQQIEGTATIHPLSSTI